MKKVILFVLLNVYFIFELINGEKVESHIDVRLNAEWAHFKINFTKSYRNQSEEAARRLLWQKSYKLIKEHNDAANLNKTHTYMLKLNKFADLTEEEFAKLYLKRKQHVNSSFSQRLVNSKNQATIKTTSTTSKPTTTTSTKTTTHTTTTKAKPTRSTTKTTTTSIKTTTTTTELATSFKTPTNVNLTNYRIDWRKLGYVSRVKDQGACGSCWAFAAIAVLEGQLYKKTGKMTLLSEQNLLDCSIGYGINNGCSGGLEYDGWQYIIDNGGLNSAAVYPYTGTKGECKYNSNNVAVQVKEIVHIQPKSEQALSEAVVSIGPIAVGIYAECISFRFYYSGIINNSNCSTNGMDHSVTVVGLDYDNITNLEYYIVKNSWGSSWGENGYVRIARSKNNQLSIASDASYALIV